MRRGSVWWGIPPIPKLVYSVESIIFSDGSRITLGIFFDLYLYGLGMRWEDFPHGLTLSNHCWIVDC